MRVCLRQTSDNPDSENESDGESDVNEEVFEETVPGSAHRNIFESLSCLWGH